MYKYSSWFSKNMENNTACSTTHFCAFGNHKLLHLSIIIMIHQWSFILIIYNYNVTQVCVKLCVTVQLRQPLPTFCGSSSRLRASS